MMCMFHFLFHLTQGSYSEVKDGHCTVLKNTHTHTHKLQLPCAISQPCRSIQSLSLNDLIFLPSLCMCGRVGVWNCMGEGSCREYREEEMELRKKEGDSMVGIGSERCF